jgi:drug/metabolite transporter (DMT)-like permease
LTAAIAVAPSEPNSADGLGMPWRIWLALAAVSLFWGSAYLAIRVMVEDIPPMLGGGARFVLSGLLLFAWCAARPGAAGGRGATPRLDARTLAEFTVLGMLLCGAGTGFLGLGERHVTSSVAALLVASVPLWMILLRAAARERTSWRGFAAAAVGFGGVGLLFLPAGGAGGTSVGGAALVLGAAVSWALGSWLTPRFELRVDVLVATAWQMLLGGLGLALIGAAAGEGGQLRPPSADALLAFAYLTVVSGALAYAAYIWLLHRAPLGQVAMFAYVSPLIAVVLGWAVLGETIGAITFLASAVIIASVVVTLRDERAVSRSPSAPPPR